MKVLIESDDRSSPKIGIGCNLQVDALTQEGYDRIFTDHWSGGEIVFVTMGLWIVLAWSYIYPG